VPGSFERLLDLPEPLDDILDGGVDARFGEARRGLEGIQEGRRAPEREAGVIQGGSVSRRRERRESEPSRGGWGHRPGLETNQILM